MKVVSSLKQILFEYDASRDGGAIGNYLSGAFSPLFCFGAIMQMIVLDPFVGGAGALISFGVTSNPILINGPLDPTALIPGVIYPIPVNILFFTSEELITAVTVNNFTAGVMAINIIFTEPVIT